MVRRLDLQAGFKANPFSRKTRPEPKWQSGFDRLLYGMPQLSISEVARMVGLRPSAIRYYEQIGILPPVKRIRGQRRYDPATVSHLVVIQRARQNGFTLDEVRELFFGFDRRTGPAARWHKLSERKLAELEASIERIRNVQRRLSQLRDGCRCSTLEECGAGFLQQRKQRED
jgi:MerR family redox-sensitive transcriptional activator SoxR